MNHEEIDRLRSRLLRPKSVAQHLYDFTGAPLRFVVLPDNGSRRLGLTSLQDERLRAVLPRITGRLLDIGAGDNLLVRLYGNGVGVDTFDFGGGAVVLQDTRRMPFESETFDTSTFLACINHIPYREEVLKEAFRLLRPGGRILATMISPLLGLIGHRLWWYSEEKVRPMAEGETWGLAKRRMFGLLYDAGFVNVRVQRFLYGLNCLYYGEKPHGTRGS